MGYDLHPRNKNVDSFHMGAFSWSWMLEQGCGLPFRTGPGPTPASYVYHINENDGPYPKGQLIHSNDGVRITSKEAKQMGMLAGWIADYWDTFNAYFKSMPQEEQDRINKEPFTSGLYRTPVREDFIQKVRAFSQWAPTSGGFRVF